ASGFAAGVPQIVLQGTVNLPQTQMLHYTVGSTDDPTQYLISSTYDTYDGTRTWSQSPTNSQNFEADVPLPAPSASDLLDTYNITIDNVTPNVRSLAAPGVLAATFS